MKREGYLHQRENVLIFYQIHSTTVEAILKDTLVSAQLYYNGCLHKTLFSSTSIQPLYFYILVSSQLQLQTPFFIS